MEGTCPNCGANTVITYPYGPSCWVENCPACGFEGGGTVSFPIEDIEAGRVVTPPDPSSP